MAKEQMNQKSITVVSDWQKRSSKKQVRFFVILAVALSVAFAATAFSFFWSKQENHALIVDNNMKYLQISGVQEADKVKDTLDEGVILISDVARYYSSMIRLMPDITVEERLRLLADLNLFDRVGYVSPDGLDTTLEGTANAEDRDYFIRGMRGETGYDFLKKSRVTGAPCVVFYAPIADGENIIGVMIGFFESSRLNNLFTMEVFSYSPNAYLLLGDGSVIANSNHESDCGNMLEILSKQTYHGEINYADIEQAIADKSRTSIQFEYLEDDKPSVGVITQLPDCDWMILSILPGNVSSAMIERTVHIGRVLMYGISTVFIFLVLVIIVMIVIHDQQVKKEMRDAQSRLQRAQAEEKKQAFIVNTLATIYHSVYLIDVASGTYEQIEERNPLNCEVFASSGNWQNTAKLYTDTFVDAPYKETLSHFLDLEQFDELIGDRSNVGVEFRRADGGWRKAVLLGQRDDETGELMSVICAVQMIDAEKEKELLAQKALQEAFDAAQLANNAKTSFLSNMSHDIRTPMNAIIGMTMIASNNLEDKDRVSDCLRKITSSCKHLLGLINEILDMSKIESGRVELEEEAFSLSTLIGDLVDMNHALVEDKGHTLTVRTEELLHPQVIGDKTRLQQVFTNLLTNAIKYTPAGGTLGITVTEDVPSTSAVGKYQVVFSDTGIGMSREDIETLFEPFTRARDKRLIGIQGTGLGMPIARNIIRMMNGDIEVESELNKGSTFKVTFMLRLQPEGTVSAEGATDQSDEDPSGVDLGGRRVLLVEDNELNLEIAVELLSMLGLEITTAGNGKEAVERFTASAPGKYDMILMDVQMPVMDGYEATAAIRASNHPEAKTIPIVAMTANAFSSDVRAALDAGMNDHIAKPIEIGNMAKVIEKYTAKK